MNGNVGQIRLSKSTRSLTGVERARDKSVQVLCELEDLPLAPFPAAHLCSWQGWGGGVRGKVSTKVGFWLQSEKNKKQSKEDFYFDKVLREVSSSLLHSLGCVSAALVSACGGRDDHVGVESSEGGSSCMCVWLCVYMCPGPSDARLRVFFVRSLVFACQRFTSCSLVKVGGLSQSLFLPPTLTPSLLLDFSCNSSEKTRCSFFCVTRGYYWLHNTVVIQ